MISDGRLPWAPAFRGGDKRGSGVRLMNSGFQGNVADDIFIQSGFADANALDTATMFIDVLTPGASIRRCPSPERSRSSPLGSSARRRRARAK